MVDVVERERLAYRAGVLSILVAWIDQRQAFMLAMVQGILLDPRVIVAVPLDDLEKEMDVDKRAFEEYVRRALYRRN